MKIRISSFGYKYNLEVRADRVYSVRRFPNPFGEFPDKNGLDKEVREWLLNKEEVRDFIDGVVGYNILLKEVDDITARFPSISIAFGCYGGKHRSVAIAEEVGRRLREMGFEVEIVHRDLYKD